MVTRDVAQTPRRTVPASKAQLTMPDGPGLIDPVTSDTSQVTGSHDHSKARIIRLIQQL